MARRSIIHTARLGTQVYDIVRQRLRAGAIDPQLRLTDIKLAEELGVSRTPVREALLQLVHDGLLMEGARGYTLPPQTPKAIRERVELRRVLMPVVACRATMSGTARQKKQLQRAFEDEQRYLDHADPEPYLEATHRFRSILMAMCGNDVMARSALLYDDMAHWYRAAAFQHTTHRHHVSRFYSQMCDAVQQGRAEDAAFAMRGIMDYAIAKIDDIVPHAA